MIQQQHKTFIGDCSLCNANNLETDFDHQLVNDKPVCLPCQSELIATEQREGARTSEARQPNHNA
jgi:formylmethanofuran dehydrogenase subunit E